MPKFNPGRINTDKEPDELEFRLQKLIQKPYYATCAEKDFEDMER